MHSHCNNAIKKYEPKPQLTWSLITFDTNDCCSQFMNVRNSFVPPVWSFPRQIWLFMFYLKTCLTNLTYWALNIIIVAIWYVKCEIMKNSAITCETCDMGWLSRAVFISIGKSEIPLIYRIIEYTTHQIESVGLAMFFFTLD